MPGAGRAGGGMAIAGAGGDPALYAGHRVFATRVLHTLLAGVTRDRLDLLGEEYFEYILKKQLKTWGRGATAGMPRGQGARAKVVLVSPRARSRDASGLAAVPWRWGPGFQPARIP